MKSKISMMLLLASAFAAGSAFAGADDTKWIAKCMVDNKNEGASTEVVTKYCTCMNNKMDDNETKSISQWEKTHKKERDECSAKAGWK